MITLSVALFCLVGLGAFAMGLRYSTSAVPASYHAEILAANGAELDGNLTLVLTALYRGFGGALVALAVAMVCLALWPVAAGNLPAAFGAFLAGTIVAGSTILTPLRVERATGVRTPWRIAAGLQLVLVAALAAFLV